MNVNVSVSDEIIKVLDYLFEKFGVVVDWSNGELLPYIKELMGKIVAYKEAIAWLWIGVAIAITIISIIIFIIGSVQSWECFHYCIGVCAIVAVGAMVIVNAYTIITCRTFPEKIVLEYIQDTISDMNSNSSSRY